MKRNTKGTLAKALVLALVLSTAATAAPEADAAKAKKPKLSTGNVSVKVNGKKTVKIKNVKTKKIKKLTVKSKKKSIASVKKSSKTKFVITGKKEGKTTVIASVKVGKKTTKLKVKVTVTGTQKSTSTPSSQPGTQSPSPSSAAPTSGTTQLPTGTPPVTPVETPSATPLVNYSEDFENGLGDWYARGSEESTELAIINTDEGRNGSKGMMITGKTRSGWEGPALDLSDCITPGGKYKVTFWAKVPEEDAEQWSSTGGIKIKVSGARFHSKEDFENGTGQAFENYPADTYYKVKTDEWTQIEVEFTAPEYFYNYVFYIETMEKDDEDIFVRYGQARFIVDDFTMERLTAPAEYDATLPSIRETYAEHGITMGVAAGYGQMMNPNTFGFIKHHFSSVTAGNEMKLDSVMKTSGAKLKITDEAAAGYVVSDAYKECADNKDAEGNVIVPEIDFSILDSYLRIAKENGMKVRIHSPFWHQQNPQHFFTKGFKYTSDDAKAEFTDQETMFTREEMYVRTLLEHIFKSGYGDVVAAYDVVNEYLNMKNEGGKVNYWKFIFGEDVNMESPYVKKAFAVAYDELVENNRTDISLIYNDYNTYNNTDKVIELINNINKKDDMNPNGDKICDGIGMQSHINGSGDEDKFEAAIEKFKDAGFEIQITELDVTNSGTVTAETSDETKALVWENNAAVYKKLMEAILRQKADGANITSVTIWGLTDATSWRSERAPLLFGSDVSDKKPSFDAVIDAAKNFGK